VCIARKAAPKQIKKKKEKPDSKAVRYAFYVMTVVLVFLIVYSLYLYYLNIITMPLAEALSSAALSLFFPFLVFSYLLAKGKNLRMITQELGLTRDKLTLKNLLIGLILFFAIIAFTVALSLFSAATNIPLPTNVSTLLSGTPLWFLIFTFLIAPINEEILFRGFLVPRVGIILSAIIFAILHLSYLSISEFLAAFVFGLLAGYVFKKRRSLYSTILAHALVNFLTIISLLYVGMYIHI
jgi:uncharacterized protein